MRRTEIGSEWLPIMLIRGSNFWSSNSIQPGSSPGWCCGLLRGRETGSSTELRDTIFGGSFSVSANYRCWLSFAPSPNAAPPAPPVDSCNYAVLAGLADSASVEHPEKPLSNGRLHTRNYCNQTFCWRRVFQSRMYIYLLHSRSLCPIDRMWFIGSRSDH